MFSPYCQARIKIADEGSGLHSRVGSALRRQNLNIPWSANSECPSASTACVPAAKSGTSANRKILPVPVNIHDEVERENALLGAHAVFASPVFDPNEADVTFQPLLMPAMRFSVLVTAAVA
jgi:hypothetical protein